MHIVLDVAPCVGLGIVYRTHTPSMRVKANPYPWVWRCDDVMSSEFNSDLGLGPPYLKHEMESRTRYLDKTRSNQNLK